MGLRDVGAALPPGFRFYPSDEELVCHYLYQKIVHPEAASNTLVEIDLHTCEPWQLPEVAKLNSTEWYFFSFRDRKYATGYRTNRATTSGYWKATGKDRTILDHRARAIVGMRKTLVFYKNRAPNGIKTSWIMHEFRLENPLFPPKEDWVLCRVFQKPKNDSTGELSPTHRVYDTTAPARSPTLAMSPPLDHAFTGGYNQFPDSPPQKSQDSDIISTFQNFPPHEANDPYTKFLFDVNFGVSSFRPDGEVPAALEEMQFDVDDGSMIFI